MNTNIHNDFIFSIKIEEPSLLVVLGLAAIAIGLLVFLVRRRRRNSN